MSRHTEYPEASVPTESNAAREEVPVAPSQEIGQSKAGQGTLLRQWGTLAVILAVGLLLRVWYTEQITHAPDFGAPVLDPQLNDYWARALVSGDWTPPEHADEPEIRATPYGRPPGYPYALALIYWLAGDSYLAPRLVQTALGLLNVLLLFLLGRRVFGGAAGLIAAGWAAVYWAFVYFEGELNSPVFEIFFSLTLVYLLLRWADRPSTWLIPVCGLLLGLFALFRPNVLLVGVCIAPWVVWAARRRGHSWRTAVRAVLFFGLGTVVAIAPALIRNYVVARDCVLISYYGGVNAYIGNNEQATGVSAKIPDIQAISGLNGWDCFSYPALVRGLARRQGKESMSFSEASRYFYGRALGFIARHPLDELRLTAKKALLFWGPAEISDSKVVTCERNYWTALRHLPGFPPVLALFLVGLGLFLWDLRLGRGGTAGAIHGEAAALALVFIAAYFASVLPFFITARYRVPVIPFLLLFGGYACVRIGGLARRRRVVPAVLLLGLCVGLWAVCRIGFVPYTPDASAWHFHRAVAYASAGRAQEAVAELRRALQANPENVEAHLRLGYELAQAGDADGALAEYREAVRIGPDHALAWNNLGYEWARRGEAKKAEDCYRTALRLSPCLTLAQNNLGNLLLEQGHAEEALAQFNAALATDPNDRFAHYNLGNALTALGRLDEAVAEYTAALKRDPRNADIHNNLGLALALQGRVDEAREEYDAAIRLDPGSALAYNNLGLLDAQQKRYNEAISHYREALECDSSYAKAYLNLGNVLGELGRYDEAVSCFDQALALAPDLTQARENRDLVVAARDRLKK